MPDKYFMSASGADFAGSLADSLRTERVLWAGRCAVAEYAFDEPNSLPRWTLPEETEVVVTEQRVVYRDGETGHTGDLRWPWPQHLRVQPGNREAGRSATVTQIQLVCAGPDETYPALVFAGGDLTPVGDADRLANILRQAIARYRVEHAADLGLGASEARMLSRLVIGPEFSNYLGGAGQTVSLLGAMAVGRPTAVYRAAAEVPISPIPVDPAVYAAPALADPAYTTAEPARSLADPSYTTAEPAYPVAGSGRTLADSTYSSAAVAEPAGASAYGAAPSGAVPAGAVGWTVGERTGLSDHAERSPANRTDPGDLASRAADLAAKVANLVSGGVDLGRPAGAQTTNLSAFLDLPPAVDGPPYGTPSTDWSADRAEQARRTAARFTGNSARSRTTGSGQYQGRDEYGSQYR